MSFDNATTCYIHLVSYPSCWLPPPPALKIMVRGIDQLELDRLVSSIQTLYPSHNFAIYHDLEFDPNSMEHLDWLLINAQHCHATWVMVDTGIDLALASVLRTTTTVGVGINDNEYLSKLIDTGRLDLCSIYELLEKVVKEKARS